MFIIYVNNVSAADSAGRRLKRMRGEDEGVASTGFLRCDAEQGWATSTILASHYASMASHYDIKGQGDNKNDYIIKM